MRFIPILLILIVFGLDSICAQTHDLNYYQALAHTNAPFVKANEQLQVINDFQNEITIAQFRKPQLNLTADYLFAPYFNNYGKVIAVTTNPDKKAFGYDIGLSNGGLYATQLNASISLFSGGILKSYKTQTQIENQILQNSSKQLLHDLDKRVSDQYGIAYSFQQQKDYIQKIIDIVLDRNKVVEALVLKGLMQQSDYLLLDIEIKQRQYDVQQLNMSIAAAFNELNNICGIRDTVVYELLPPEIVRTLLKDQFNYTQKYELDSSGIFSQEQVYNSKYKPQLAAFGNTGLNSADATNLYHNTGISAGLHLVIPLYDGGQKKIVRKQNRILLENLKLSKEQMSIELENTLASLQSQISFTQLSLDLVNSQISSQEKLLSILKDKILTGQISVIDYLNSLQDYATSVQNKISNQTNLWSLINQYNYINW